MALIPPRFLNTVVALGGPSQDRNIRYTATGFLYGYPTGQTDSDGAKRYRIYLVTNRHVFQKACERNTALQARFNRPMGTGANVYHAPLQEPDGSTSWTVHPDSDVDVAILQINPNKLKKDGIEFEWFASDTHTFTVAQARTSEVSEGDGVFLLGFPLGEAGHERNYAIVRQGIIARAQDWLKGDARTFLIDASVFPGNSGGPVLLKPEATSIKGTKSNNRCGLIGMVSSYLPYQEIAVSTQTNRPRMIFEENSGLGIVVPHDLIQETVEIAVRELDPKGAPKSDSEATPE